MVIVRLHDGLGNQLFQYAAARRAAHINNTTLKLDISSFTKAKRRYSLNHFNIIEDFASVHDIDRIKSQPCLSSEYYACPVIREQFFQFDPNILKVSEDVFFEYGYWQSEKYFADIENIIRKEFTLKYELEGKNKELADYIMNCQSVCLHIRRGDYIAEPELYSKHGVCEWEYYQRCITELAEKISDMQFFIFSDDPEWILSNINLDYPTTFVTHNSSEKDYEDLRLFSLGKHNIIANSSFSWWGAWLNQNPDKIVFAPIRWFNWEMDTGDLIPASWRKL